MSLRRIAGETILSAIEKVAPSNVGSQLANILKLKFGDLILAQKEIRLAILDTLDLHQAETFCGKVRLTAPNHAAACRNLQQYFDTWSETKSGQYVAFYNLSPAYRHSPMLDTRKPKLLVSAKRGETVQLKGILHKYQQTGHNRRTKQTPHWRVPSDLQATRHKFIRGLELTLPPPKGLSQTQPARKIELAPQRQAKNR